jgi:hypothetical protein
VTGRASAAGLVLALVSAPVLVAQAGHEWRALPSLVARAGEARAGVRVEERRAFGDTASGCFLVEQRISAPAEALDAEVAMRSFTEGLAARGFEVKRSGEGIELRGRGIEGRARTVFAAAAQGRTVAVSTACFHNQREPERCRARCDERLAQVVP